MAVKDKERDARKYKGRFNISSPILLDEDAKVATAYEVWGHPETFFINREGKIVGRASGGKDWTTDRTKNLIQYLLKEKT